MKIVKIFALILMAFMAFSPTYACEEDYPDIWEDEINFCRDNQEN